MLGWALNLDFAGGGISTDPFGSVNQFAGVRKTGGSTGPRKSGSRIGVRSPGTPTGPEASGEQGGPENQ